MSFLRNIYVQTFYFIVKEGLIFDINQIKVDKNRNEDYDSLSKIWKSIFEKIFKLGINFSFINDQMESLFTSLFMIPFKRMVEKEETIHISKVGREKGGKC